MKQFHLVLLHRLVVSKRFYLWLSLLIGLGIKASLQNNPLQTKEDTFLTVYYQIAHPILLTFFLIPCFLFLIGIVTNVFHRNQILLKYSRAQDWWRDQNIVLLLFSFLYTIMIHGVILGGSVAHGGMEILTSDFLLFLGVSSTIQLLGFILLGIGYSIISLLTNSYIGFFAIILLVTFIDVLKRLFNLGIYTLQEYMSVSFYTGALSEIPLSLFLFLPTIVLLYFYGNLLSCKKDYFWS